MVIYHNRKFKNNTLNKSQFMIFLWCSNYISFIVYESHYIPLPLKSLWKLRPIYPWNAQVIMTSAFHVISNHDFYKTYHVISIEISCYIYWDLVDFMHQYRDSLEVEISPFRRIYSIVVLYQTSNRNTSSGATTIYQQGRWTCSRNQRTHSKTKELKTSPQALLWNQLR